MTDPKELSKKLRARVAYYKARGLEEQRKRAWMGKAHCDGRVLAYTDCLRMLIPEAELKA